MLILDDDDGPRALLMQLFDTTAAERIAVILAETLTGHAFADLASVERERFRATARLSLRIHSLLAWRASQEKAAHAIAECHDLRLSQLSVTAQMRIRRQAGAACTAFQRWLSDGVNDAAVTEEAREQYRTQRTLADRVQELAANLRRPS